MSVGNPSTVDLVELENIYIRDIRIEANLSDDTTRLADSVRLFNVVSAVGVPECSLSEVIELIDNSLEITYLLANGEDLHGDKEGWSEFKQQTRESGHLSPAYTAGDFSREGESEHNQVTSPFSPQQQRTSVWRCDYSGARTRGVSSGSLGTAEPSPRTTPLLRRFHPRKKTVVLVYGRKYRKRDDSIKVTGASQFASEVHERLKKSE